MPTPRSDALVFFGATGDLAYKKIFPALQAMMLRDGLDLPIIGVAHSGWNVEQLRQRAHDSLAQAAQEQGGAVDEAAFAKLAARLHYVDGDYNDAATFQRLKQALGRTWLRRPDLIDRKTLSKSDRQLLDGFLAEHAVDPGKTT